MPPEDQTPEKTNWLIQSSAITKMMDFQMGFPHNFIEKAFEGNQNLIDHFTPKLQGLPSSMPPMAIIPTFWSFLSEGNRAILMDYILNKWGN